MFWKRKKSERILFEDTLKHIYNGEYQRMPATLLSLAGALGLNDKDTLIIVEKMENKKMIQVSGTGLSLTALGKAGALQVIRAHRLWESYLVNEVGIPLKDIHEQAELKEHTITPDEVDKLEAQLGYPLHDPHGDPIPSKYYDIEPKKNIALVDWKIGKFARIKHIEDEPQAIYTQILSEGLIVNTYLKIIEANEKGFHLWTNVNECWIAPIVAANIFVEAAPVWVKEIQGEALSVLNPGETGKILDLKCQGLTRRRFLDLGLLPGTKIEAVMRSALAEPLAYKVRETIIALRKDQANQILIEPR